MKDVNLFGNDPWSYNICDEQVQEENRHELEHFLNICELGFMTPRRSDATPGWTCICRQELEQSAQCIRSSSRAKPSEVSSCAKQRPPRSSATLSHGAMAVPDRAVATHGGGARSPLPRRGRRCKPWRDLGGGTGWRCKGAALGRKEALCHTRFMKANRIHLICAPESVYTHMIKHKVNITTSASVKRVLSNFITKLNVLSK